MKGTRLVHQTISYLEETKGKPFALRVSFHAPYSPFDFPVAVPDTAYWPGRRAAGPADFRSEEEERGIDAA